MRVLKNAIQNCSQNFIGTEVSGTGVFGISMNVAVKISNLFYQQSCSFLLGIMHKVHVQCL